MAQLVERQITYLECEGSNIASDFKKLTELNLDLFTSFSLTVCIYTCVVGFKSHPRQLIFLWRSDCLGCAVLLCLVICLTLLACFLPSFFISH